MTTQENIKQGSIIKAAPYKQLRDFYRCKPETTVQGIGVVFDDNDLPSKVDITITVDGKLKAEDCKGLLNSDGVVISKVTNVTVSEGKKCLSTNTYNAIAFPDNTEIDVLKHSVNGVISYLQDIKSRYSLTGDEYNAILTAVATALEREVH